MSRLLNGAVISAATLFTLFCNSPSFAVPIADQGQIFGTGGTVDVGTGPLSQSITTGIAGQLTGIQIQFNADSTDPAPPLHLSILPGGNPPGLSTLFTQTLDLGSVANSELFTWDVASSNLFFDAGDQFTFTLSAGDPGFVIAGNDGPGYAGGELFLSGAELPSMAVNDIAFITFVDPDAVPPPPISTGAILYGVVTGFGSGGGVSDPGGSGSGGGRGGQSFLVTVDQISAAVTEVGEIGFGGSLSALAADSSGNLYTVEGGRREGIRSSAPDSELISVDRSTGAGISLGLTDIENRAADPTNPDPSGEFGQFGSQRQNVSDMSFDSSDSLFGIVARGSQLGNFDPVFGGSFATKVGDTVCDDSFCARGNALAFDASDTLFMAAALGGGFLGPALGTELFTLDPMTGSPLLPDGILVDYSLLPDPNPTDAYRIGGMDFHPLTGELFVTVLQGEPQTAPPSNTILGILDFDFIMNTAVVIPIGETSRKLEGIAFVQTAPEPATLLLLAMGLGGIGFGRARLRTD